MRRTAKNGGEVSPKGIPENIRSFPYADFNDGGMKSFYCHAVNLLLLKELKCSVCEVENAGRELREQKKKAQATKEVFQKSAASRGITLELRKEIILSA